MIKKEKLKLVWKSPPSFPIHVPCANYNNLNLNKEQAILIPANYNHTCKEEIDLWLSRRFSKAFLNEFQNSFFC